jgi:hypothetical protein
MGPRIGSDPPPTTPHQQSSSARHVLEISTPEKERERIADRQVWRFQRQRGSIAEREGERVIERETEGEGERESD